VIEAAKGNRHDATMILLTFRHGLRAAEVCDLRWDQVDFTGAVLHVRRVKNGTRRLISRVMKPRRMGTVIKLSLK
jgi:integrase